MTKVFVICMAFLGMVLPGDSLAGSLNDNGNGTVTDSKTHLIWQQEESGEMNWDSAISYCKNLSLAGYSDWRLPNIEELKSIIAVGKTPAINKTNFPHAELELPYWSSTTRIRAGYPPQAWVVGFDDGHSYYPYKASLYYVRCVRGGK